ncbi:MAG: EAL domain-containing protein [Burkholderiaceae bacterium]|nr:EAL domain-containing protein [Burkholderiaceae bacterium]
MARDVTQRKADQKRLQLAASVFTHAREGIIITDVQGNIVDVNETFTRITGYSSQEVLGRNPRFLRSDRQGPDFYKAMWQSLTSKGHWYGELWNHTKDGSLYAEMLTIGTVYDDDGQALNYVGLFSDITLQKEHQQELEHIAHYDPLTNLPNRVLLSDRLRQAMAQCQRSDSLLAVVFLDLDGFKSINDRHGHDVGDLLLISLAQRLKNALREGDTLARIGGDEFIAVLAGLENSNNYVPVLERMLQAAAEPVPFGKIMLQVSASLGVTIFPQDAADAEQLMRHADQAMYQAKQAGKNCYHIFDIKNDITINTHTEQLIGIIRALHNNEFVLYYQPKVNIRTNEIIGSEALIRWQHPEKGLLEPSHFLPILEGKSAAAELDEWVIDKVFEQLVEWKTHGFSTPVSINISAVSLQNHGFVQRLYDRQIKYPQLSSNIIELEILETSTLEDITTAASIITACKNIGIKFALDDFGTGYSSLTYLRRLPADQLKIDQSFIRDMLDDPDDLAIVKGIMGLAEAFKRTVIAEGVESTAHGELLLDMGCELAQGYGIAHPMPPEMLPNWSAQWTKL